METSVIISRFNENLDWIENINKDYIIYLYNKGEDITLKKSINSINLPNVGRESHTWLYHITNNYENISDNNIFLQGRIDDLGCMAYKDLERYLNNLEVNRFNVSRLGLLTPFHWKKNLTIPSDKRYKKDWENAKISRNEIGFRKFAKEIFPNIPIFVATSYGGCFAVSKEAIYSHSKDFYIKLLSKCNHHEHPIEAHFLERLWCFMFSQNFQLNKALLDIFKTKIEKITKLDY